MIQWSEIFEGVDIALDEKKYDEFILSNIGVQKKYEEYIVNNLNFSEDYYNNISRQSNNNKF